jgi:DNA helicase II / ATP-dependent DNA helicase PcrA
VSQVIRTPSDLQRVMGASYALSPEQFRAVTAPLEPAVVVAGAGSGKTTLMAARVVHLVATGQARPEQVLGLTFTTKAAAELDTRIRTALRQAGLNAGDDETGEPLEPTVSTYNAYAAALLHDHGLRIGHEPDTRVITDAARHQLGARVVSRHGRRVERLSDHPPTVIKAMLALDSAMNEHLVSPADVRALHRRLRPEVESTWAEARCLPRTKTWCDDLQKALDVMAGREELLHLVEEYRTLKRALGLMEFSDQISLGTTLARTRPEVGELERERFTVVLLDEYQDTSVAQALMLAALFSGPDVDRGLGHPVMAVGDPNQAIYGWRGASVSNILHFAQSFPPAPGREPLEYSLPTNRRSDRRILDLANEVAAPLYAARPGLAPLRPAEEAGAGALVAELFGTYDEELEWLAGEVGRAHERIGSWREIAVLTRDNAHAADVFEALSRADVPVEIVGLKGLLQLPEVADVVATLTLLQDITANAALLTLLSGPRWAIGVRDLKLLGERAAALAGGGATARATAALGIEEALAEAVAGADPTEVPALSDALDDPGDAPYSAEARERFGALSTELRRLRRHVDEPLLDLVRRIIDASGLDVELASSVSPSAAARRDNLDLFVRAVADFRAVDGEVSLLALLSYLDAEDEEAGGMEVSTPTAADTVKLLTVHRAKGLEWDEVFLVGVAEGKFPNRHGRPSWLTTAGAIPGPLRGDAIDLPVLGGWSKEALEAFRQEGRDHEAMEERRLAYVAFTRPRHRLTVTSYVWGRTQKRPLGASAYHRTAREQVERLAASSELPVPGRWPPMPVAGTPNPCAEAASAGVAWPVTERTLEAGRRRHLAAEVAAEMQGAPGSSAPGSSAPGPGATPAGVPVTEEAALTAQERALLATWDEETDRLLEEARARVSEHVDVPLPPALSVSTLASVRTDPEGVARRLVRPMPLPPSPAARFGTRFHAWVESWFDASRQDPLLDPDEIDGRGDLVIEDDEELARLVAAFRAGPLADRKGAVVEAPFAVVLAGQVVRGRIDAAFPEDDGGWLLVDWKTNRRHDADPWQLAAYRVAWAELHDLPLARVRAGFYYVRDGSLVVVDDLPGRAELEAALRGSGPA